MKTSNIIASTIFIIGGILVFFYTNSFPSTPGEDVGSAFMPKIYASFLTILGVILLFKSIFINNEEGKGNIVKIIMYILTFTIFIILIPILGFYVSAIIFLIMLLVISKERNKFYYLILPIGIIVFIYLLFQQLLNVPLPEGLLF
ncbi:tripartite tricarboxylate transporter TctB family protein [Oceanobacillus locisalsi]|uniref:Tripartite tricarboxylate transporter TctB family protein n=1 Tax=Oceanobacillus locisalsi TaxID=546107 RepID=A0ABW3NKU0_9BACI